jgi:hypothetical protein
MAKTDERPLATFASEMTGEMTLDANLRENWLGAMPALA